MAGSTATEAAGDGRPKKSPIQELSKSLGAKYCPRLNSLSNEVLRYYNSPISLRELTRDTLTATGEILRGPALLMMPHRENLLDAASASSPWMDAKSFDAERFLIPVKDETATTTGTTQKNGSNDRRRGEMTLNNDLLTSGKNKYFYPFGGGQTLCPGRFLAKSAGMVFAALLVTRFDMSPTGPLPTADPQSKSGLGVGILGVRDGEDSVLVLEPRSS